MNYKYIYKDKEISKKDFEKVVNDHLKSVINSNTPTNMGHILVEDEMEKIKNFYENKQKLNQFFKPQTQEEIVESFKKALSQRKEENVQESKEIKNNKDLIEIFKQKSQKRVEERLKKELSQKLDTSLLTTNNKEAFKETEGKLFYELDWAFVTEMAQRMASNKKNSKYSLFNWKIPMTSKGIEDLKQATMRHLLEVMQGRYEDDTNLGHIIAIANNAMILNYQLKTLQDKK